MTEDMEQSNYFFSHDLREVDPETEYLIKLEEERQARKIMLIASESICPKPVREALSSVYTNLYAEGYPHMRYIRDERDELLDYDRQLTFHRRYADRRYYKGVDYVNFIESLAQKRCAELFATKENPSNRIWVNVQPLSGAAANNAIYDAFLEPGDTVMGMALDCGGHLTHGSEANRSGKYYKIVSYSVSESTNRLDYDEIKKLAIHHKPKMIIAGYSAYPWDIDWKKFREIADSVEGGCLLHADIAHTAGLVSAGVVSNPIDYADTIAFTTHKTMCGPRGAVIITKDEECARAVETAVFPSEQGGPHICNIAAKAVSFNIAQGEEYKTLAQKIVDNARYLGESLEELGLELAYGGTNTHMVLIDLKKIETKSGFPLSGEIVSRILDQCGLTCNKNAICGDENPVHPSAIRLGTTWVTQRGIDRNGIKKIAELVHKVVTNIEPFIYIGGGGEIGRGKIDFDLLEEVKREVVELESTLARDIISFESHYPHYYSLNDGYTNKSPLKEVHKELGANFEDIRGFDIPTHFDGPDSEFEASKEHAALFDMWDVGVLEITGDHDRVLPFLQQVLTNNVSDLQPQNGMWSYLLDKDSKPLGDVHILRLNSGKKGRGRYLLMVSGDSIQRIITWLRALSDGYVVFDDEDVFAKVEGPVVVRDLKEVPEDEQLCVLALIGPKAKEILDDVASEISSLNPGESVRTEIQGEQVLVTHQSHGDFLGYDIFLKPTSLQRVWSAIMSSGREFHIKPAGFRARMRIRSNSDLPVDYSEHIGTSLYEAHSDLFDLKKSYFVGQRRILGSISHKQEKKKYAYNPQEMPPKKSCLYKEHIKLTKKMVPFAGWEMPLWYTKTSDEHLAVRNAAGLFDVSHMGILEFSGEHSTRFLDHVATNYVPWLRPGQSHYSYILDPEGKVLDDVFLYRLDYEKYMMVVNAANMDKIKAWLSAVSSREFSIDLDNPLNEIEGPVTIKDLKDGSSGPDMKVDLSLQGPNSLKILQTCADETAKKELASLKKLEFMFVNLDGINAMVSRTGYTGEEMGFELYIHPDDAPKLWGLLLDKGQPFGIKPCGLGARDSTRTEAGFPLYGNELAGAEDIDPVEAGYGSFVRFHKPFFIGRRPLFERHLKTNRAVIRFRMLEKGIRAIRPNYPVYDLEGEDIGLVTSCTLIEGIQVGMALVECRYAIEGEHINVSLVSPDRLKEKGERQRGKDFEKAEIMPRFMMEIDEGDTPKKI